MNKSELAQELTQHLKDNDGEVVYWGDSLPSPRQSFGRGPDFKDLDPGQTARRDDAQVARNENKEAILQHFRTQTIGDCHLCPLGNTRIKLVFGVGNPEAEVMFVGEGPGFDEDRKGEPFVGKAGQLLDKIISSIGLDRSKVYIANVVKCHPMVDSSDPEKRGNDRPPSPEEMEKCLPFLKEQIRIIRPRIIVTLGATATKALLERPGGITSLRGKLYDFEVGEGLPTIKLLPTFHPAALLRDENLKRPVWEDMKLLKKTMNGFGF